MSTPYHVGLYALVQHHGNYLMVRQVTSTLPPGRYGLPGASLTASTGSDIAELHLRRTLLAQLGVSVGELLLSGSHTLRLPDGTVLLNLIFGTDYNSGVPNPQEGVIVDLEWCSPGDLGQRPDAPDWLLTTIRNYQIHLAAGSSEAKRGGAAGRGLLKWGR